MSSVLRIPSRAVPVAAALVLLHPVCHAAGISATATYTDSQVSPGVYDYSLTLNNTGATAIGTFWFAWVPGAGFLSSTPTAIGDPANWTAKLTAGNLAIQWTTTTPLMPEQSLQGFSFESTEIPAALLLDVPGMGTGAGDPVTTSFVYIGAPLGDPGFQFTATPAAVATTPEPGSIVLTVTGLAFLCLLYKGRLRSSVPIRG